MLSHRDGNLDNIDVGCDEVEAVPVDLNESGFLVSPYVS